MDISAPYTKVRKNFGRQPMFCEVPVHLLDTIDPNVSEQKKYMLRNPVNSSAQVSRPQSEHHVNTKQIEMRDQSINHAEGGWPKDVLYNDEEMTNRVRRRCERDDSYVDAVLGSYSKFQHYINQNNAIDMYNMYFKEMPPQEPIEKTSMRVNNVYKAPDDVRPISSIAWTLEEDSKLVVAYCDKRFPILKPVNDNFNCYIWDLESPLFPILTLMPPSACWKLVCSSYHPSLLIGGLEDGRVCLFDLRVQLHPQILSPMHLAHRDPVSALLYIQSRTNTEFFSGSTDGRCMWWDIRKLESPTEVMMMSIRAPPGQEISMANSEGVSCLQFEKTLPTRFLCGTETGFVINVNRKGKTHNEIMSAVFSAHNGPVKAINRSPCSTKIFITCGDWSVHIWSDDVHTSPIITGTKQRYITHDVKWAPLRVSSYMTVGSDGKFRFWDLLRKQHEPIIVTSLSSSPLLKVEPHEEGRVVAVGNSKGEIILISLSDNLTVSCDNDKQLMIQIYDRESLREHILETKVKEIRLKMKTDETSAPVPVEVVDDEAVLKSAEDEYRRIVTEETRRLGVGAQQTATAKREMRKR